MEKNVSFDISMDGCRYYKRALRKKKNVMGIKQLKEKRCLISQLHQVNPKEISQ